MIELLRSSCRGGRDLHTAFAVYRHCAGIVSDNSANVFPAALNASGDGTITEEGEVVEIHPEASNEAAGAVIEIKVFPGEEVSFASLGGMNISKLSAEEDTESPDIYS